MAFHPAAQILTWCLLVAALQVLALDTLLLVAGAILLCALVLSGHKLVQLVRRTRWILLSLLLIYAYSTPGSALLEELGAFSPSVEGLADGVVQLARLLAALAGLAILLDRLHRHKLIAGLYTLFAPLCWMGMSRERLAVRLALTLHYAEVAMLRAQTWQQTLHSLSESHDEAVRELELPIYRFTLADGLLLGIALLVLGLAVS
ncbi:MAG: hypothetical protein IPM27_02880 [Nitrosomonadales bacterium]|nr:hypothetical protein [Nitrosomonadales bacterium]